MANLPPRVAHWPIRPLLVLLVARLRVAVHRCRAKGRVSLLHTAVLLRDGEVAQRSSGTSLSAAPRAQGWTRVLPDSRSGRVPPGWQHGGGRPWDIDEARQCAVHGRSNGSTTPRLTGRA